MLFGGNGAHGSIGIFDNIYTNSVILKVKQSSADTQVAAGKNNYRKLQSVFENFHNTSLSRLCGPHLSGSSLIRTVSVEK